MAICVLYNPSDISAKAIIVNVPSNANVMYAYELAKKERKRNSYYTSIECNLNVVGNQDDAKYIAFIKKLNRFIPVAIGDSIPNINELYGSSVIIAPLERLLITSLQELMSVM